MAVGARVRDFEPVRLSRRDEVEGVAAHIHIRNRLLDFRHMTGNAFTPGAACFVVRVLFNGSRVRSILRVRAMARHAHLVHGPAQHRIVLAAMRIVATEAGDSPRIHETLHEIISLHPVFVRRTIRKMRERKVAGFVFFQRPVVCKLQAHMETDRPIVIAAGDRILQRPALRVALNAGVVRRHEIHPGRIEDIVARRLAHMFAARAVAALAPDIPFCHGFGLDVVIDRMASVA